MNEAFRDLAQGNLQSGLHKLAGDEQWKDDVTILDGAFYLGFPGAHDPAFTLSTSEILASPGLKARGLLLPYLRTL